METAGYMAAILIGISLGALGGGGAILTVPVLVYFMHINPLLATTYSLFVVGSCSLVGSIRAFLSGQIDLPAILYFGASSLLAVFLVRSFLVPAIPEKMLLMGSYEISRDFFFMTLFALLMLAVAFFIIRRTDQAGSGAKPVTSNKVRVFGRPAMLLQGVLAGIVTGLLGAGGGFLILPALVLFGRLPMRTAVGSSLTIIACNSFLGFFSTLARYEINWGTLLLFTGIAIGGIFIGTHLSGKIPGTVLKKGFGWFVLLIGMVILARQFVFY